MTFSTCLVYNIWFLVVCVCFCLFICSLINGLFVCVFVLCKYTMIVCVCVCCCLICFTFYQQVVFVSEADDYIVAVATVVHEYRFATNYGSPWQVVYEYCCRNEGLMNNRKTRYMRASYRWR